MSPSFTTMAPPQVSDVSAAHDWHGLVAVDLDGTLLNNDNQPDRGAEEALTRIHQANLAVVIASSRSPLGIENALSGVELRDVWTCAFQGALILPFGKPTSVPLSDHHVDREDVRRVGMAATQRGIPLGAYDRRAWYVTGVTAEIERESELTRQEPIEIASDMMADLNVHKLQLIVSEGRTEDLVDVVPLLSSASVGSFSHTRYLEITNRLATKGLGLQTIASHLDVPKWRTAAIGDGDNDISMIETAWLGVAMGNATPELKARADRVTSSNDEGGLAEAVDLILGKWHEGLAGGDDD